MSELGLEPVNGQQLLAFTDAVKALEPFCLEGEQFGTAMFEYILDGTRVAQIAIARIEADEDLGITQPSIDYAVNVIETTYHDDGEVRISTAYHVYLPEEIGEPDALGAYDIVYAEETSCHCRDGDGDLMVVASPIVEKLVLAEYLQAQGRGVQAARLNSEAFRLLEESREFEGRLERGETATYLGYMVVLSQIHEELGLAA